VMGFFKIGFQELFVWDWLRTSILLMKDEGLIHFLPNYLSWHRASFSCPQTPASQTYNSHWILPLASWVSSL
jgi:hypothetical protein